MIVVIIAMPTPYHPVVELNDPAVRGVHGAGIPSHDPDAVRGKPISPGAEWLVGSSKQVQIPAVLRHIG